MTIEHHGEQIVNGRLCQVGKAFRNLMGKSKVLCAVFMCECGESKVLQIKHVKTGQVKTCGCAVKKHGKSKTQLHKKWISMRERCSNPNKKGYENYGGRGIRVCERWNSFEAFESDMGKCPSGHTIDRIDVNGNSEPSNCRWLSHQDQCRNTRINRMLTIGDTAKTVAEWSEQNGAQKQKTIHARIAAGWSHYDAVFKPARINRVL